jgi:hypothetical protein
MNSTQILSGNNGFLAAAFSRSVLCNQLAFDYNRAKNQREVKDTPAHDAALEAALNEALGTNGLPVVKKLNAEEIADAHAACYILLRRSLSEKDPETGRSPQWLAPRLIALPDAVVSNVDRLTQYNISRAKAEAEKLSTNDKPVDCSSRIAAIQAEGDALAKEMRQSVVGPWLQSVKSYAKADTSDLIDVVLEAIVNTGRDPASEIRRAADAMQEGARKRYEAGQFASLETSIYALTTAATRKAA